MPHTQSGPQPKDIVIAVMGPTGAGKSTFINHLTGAGIATSDDMESSMVLPVVLAFSPLSSD